MINAEIVVCLEPQTRRTTMGLMFASVSGSPEAYENFALDCFYHAMRNGGATGGLCTQAVETRFSSCSRW